MGEHGKNIPLLSFQLFQFRNIFNSEEDHPPADFFRIDPAGIKHHDFVSYDRKIMFDLKVVEMGVLWQNALKQDP